MISTSGHLIPKFPEVRFHRTRIFSSISNNAAENAIRPFTVGRKNWLFADTPKGASASAAVYSDCRDSKWKRLECLYLLAISSHVYAGYIVAVRT